MSPVPERPAVDRPAVPAHVDFDEVSDEFDEGDLLDEPASGLPETAPDPDVPRSDRTALLPGRVPPAQRPRPLGPQSGPTRTPPGVGVPDGADAGAAPGRMRLLWAAGAAAVVVLAVAFLLIAKPFADDDQTGTHDSGTTGGSTSARTSRDEGSDDATPTESGLAPPGRVAPGTGGLPAPDATRSADPGAWAASICSAVGNYKESSDGLSDDIDDAVDSATPGAKMSSIAEKGHNLLIELRSTLSAIDDAQGDDQLTKVQVAVTEATGDAADDIDPDNPANAGRSPGKLGATIKGALATPITTLRSEVDDLDKQSKKTITDTKACAPLDL